jgi:hypothetical protein
LFWSWSLDDMSSPIAIRESVELNDFWTEQCQLQLRMDASFLCPVINMICLNSWPASFIAWIDVARRQWAVHTLLHFAFLHMSVINPLYVRIGRGWFVYQTEYWARRSLTQRLKRDLAFGSVLLICKRSDARGQVFVLLAYMNLSFGVSSLVMPPSMFFCWVLCLMSTYSSPSLSKLKSKLFKFSWLWNYNPRETKCTVKQYHTVCRRSIGSLISLNKYVLISWRSSISIISLCLVVRDKPVRTIIFNVESKIMLLVRNSISRTLSNCLFRFLMWRFNVARTFFRVILW